VEIAVTTMEMKKPDAFTDADRAILQRVLVSLMNEIFERLDSAVRLDPTYGEAFLLRAQMHADAGHGQKALADLQKAKTLLPAIPPALEERIRSKARASSATSRSLTAPATEAR
jgi:hypothetical protein